jgi:hypothetical protein
MAELDPRRRRRVSYGPGSTWWVFAALAVITAIGCWLTPDRGSGWWEPIGFGAIALLNGITAWVAWSRGDNSAAAE